jgi:feruloyl esterase
MVDPLVRGYAVAGTDDGHQGGGGAAWAIGHPEKLIDFGHRAVHETNVQSRAVVRAFYGREPTLSYFGFVWIE